MEYPNYNKNINKKSVKTYHHAMEYMKENNKGQNSVLCFQNYQNIDI